MESPCPIDRPGERRAIEVPHGWPAPSGGGPRSNWALSRRDGSGPLEPARREPGLG